MHYVTLEIIKDVINFYRSEHKYRMKRDFNDDHKHFNFLFTKDDVYYGGDCVVVYERNAFSFKLTYQEIEKFEKALCTEKQGRE